MADDVPPMRRNFERGVNAAVFFAPESRMNAVAIGDVLNRADAVRKKVDAHHEKMRPEWERKEYERLRKEHAQTPSLRLPAPRPSFGGAAEYDHDRTLRALARVNVAERSETNAIARLVRVRQHETKQIQVLRQDHARQQKR
jgi:hypothetical protein